MKFFKYIVYISLLFLVFALYKANYIVLPDIVAPYAALLSFIFLFAGFIMNALSWRQVLKANLHKTSVSDSIASVGLSVFGKYIPGKVWLIVGRAAYIAEKYSLKTAKLSSLSLNAQLIILWLGLMFGATGLLILRGIKSYGWIILIMWLILTIIIFSDVVHRIVEKLIKNILKRTITIPRLNFIPTIRIIPWFILYWLFYSAGFYFLVKSLSSGEVPVAAAFAFPLAGTLGVMAIIAPGGLGVREGVMVTYLVLAGFSAQAAMSISIAARLWYLIGEIFIFITGIIINRSGKSKNNIPDKTITNGSTN